MPRIYPFLIMALMLLVTSCSVRPMPSAQGSTAAPATAPGTLPHVFSLDPAALIRVRTKAMAGDEALAAPLTQLKVDADKALNAGPFSVMAKSVLPPSGDKHDYLSEARYWWPEGASTDEPYVRHDGQTNPTASDIPDEHNFDTLADATHTLALAYFYTDNEAYAAHATLLLRTWFLDPATRMNPNLNYCQVVEGKNGGFGNSVIDLRALTDIVDDVGLIQSSAAWSEADQQGMQLWFTQYLHWLLTSDVALTDSKRTNNHGSWYDAQVVAIALFIGDTQQAQQTLQGVITNRLSVQIASDGRQPLELVRTRSWDYSLFNLAALFRLAALSERVGVDLWHTTGSNGAGLRTALDWLVPFASGEQHWSYQQITPWSATAMAPLLRQAAIIYGDDQYEQLSTTLLGTDAADSRFLLTLPI